MRTLAATKGRTMRLTHVRVLTADHQRSLAFYRDLLGLDVSLEVEGVYAELVGGGALVALYRKDLMEQVVGSSGDGSGVMLTFEVDDVDATHSALAARGVGFVTDPHDQEAWYIRVAHLKDPDGHLIEINHPLEPK